MAAKGNRKRLIEEPKREEEYLEDEEKTLSFRRNAFLIICEMVKLNAKHPTLLLDEVLHSIFFLAKLYDPEFTPKSIVSNDDISEELKLRCPRAFDLYSSQVPKRSPFSCVLDMIVHLHGQKNDEMEIIERLQDFISQLEPGKSKALVSSTICVTQSNDPKSVKYGVSMSTSDRNPGKIMVAASCLSSWDSKVADAVMTYYPNKTKKPYFDGTIKLPQHVSCQAFNISSKSPMPPCRSCGNLFGLETSETNQWAYGNCAEAESLSNLLKVEKVREQVRQTSETCTDRNRERVRESVLKELKRLLGYLKFKWDNEKFYDPGV